MWCRKKSLRVLEASCSWDRTCGAMFMRQGLMWKEKNSGERNWKKEGEFFFLFRRKLKASKSEQQKKKEV